MNIGELVENCEKEELHLSGKIQAFGALLIIDAESLSVVYASENLSRFLNEDAQTLLGKTVNELAWWPDVGLSALEHKVGSRYLNSDVSLPNGQAHLRFIRGDGMVSVEIEPVENNTEIPSLSSLESSLYAPDTEEEWHETDYFNHFLDVMHELLPYNRLMLYRFQEDWVGEVVAEAVIEGNKTYLGLKFPASDIPAIARQMYFENPSRVIVDAPAQPVTILGSSDALPDLTHSDLRSVSPVHVEYLTNMTVKASFSIPIIISGKLWGIVACHDSDALLVDAQVRYRAEHLTKAFCAIFSSFLANKRLRLLKAIDERLSSFRTALVSSEDAWGEILAEKLREEFNGDAAATFWRGEWSICGQLLKDNLETIDRQIRCDTSALIYSTQDLRKEVNISHASRFRGMLVIKGSFETDSLRCYIFRRAESQHTEWAGNPDKTAQKATSEGKLSPRSSFKKWTETTGDNSLPWTKEDELVAKKTRALLIAYMKDKL